MYWEEFEAGAVYETEARTVTETDLLMYAGLSGDWNEVHTNAETAASNNFGGRIAYGAQVIAHSFGAMARLGLWEKTGVAVLNLTWDFKGPVFLGDTIRIRMTIAETRPTSNPERGLVVRDFDILNQRDQVVQHGTITMLILRAPAHLVEDA